MRVLHVFDHSLPLQSGYVFRSRSIIREQRALGWETYHVTGPKQMLSAIPPPEETADDLLFYRTPPDSRFISRLPAADPLAVIHALRDRIHQVVDLVQPDILHAHSPALNGVAMLKATKKLNIPTLYEVRGFWEDAAVSHGTTRSNGFKYHLSRALESWVLRNVDAVACICEGIKGDLVRRGIAEDRIITVPNAVDPERFSVGLPKDHDLERSLGLVNKQVIGFVGSFYAYEGLKLLLAAMPSILRKNPHVRLLLVGGGQEADELKQLARSEGIEQQVIFTGRIPHYQVAHYYSLIDILCYPRLPMRLTDLVTPLKPLEAMAQKKLVIASDVGGHRELIRDGDTGILFRAGDLEDLVNKVLLIFNNRKSWPGIVSAGREFVERERTWRASVANYIPAYERLRAMHRKHTG